MNFLPEKIEQYAIDHTQREPEVLSQLTREVWQTMVLPRMSSGHLQGRVLSAFSKMIRPENVLEIGTYAAYSTWCLLEGLSENGSIISIDVNDELSRIHNKYAAVLDTKGKVKFIYGRALDVLPRLKSQWDIVFIDADKENYLNYYESVVPQTKSGGWILIDNVLWSGKVIEPVSKGDIETQVLLDLNKRVTEDERVENVLLPIRDGIMMVRKK